jgi:hypothetical protein
MKRATVPEAPKSFTDALERSILVLKDAEREHNLWFHSNGQEDGYCYLYGAACNGRKLNQFLPWWKWIWWKITGREERNQERAWWLGSMIYKSKASYRSNLPSGEKQP